MAKVTVLFENQLDKALLEAFDTVICQLNDGHGPAWSRTGAIKRAMRDWVLSHGGAFTAPALIPTPASPAPAYNPASTVLAPAPASTPPTTTRPSIFSRASSEPVKVTGYENNTAGKVPPEAGGPPGPGRKAQHGG